MYNGIPKGPRGRAHTPQGLPHQHSTKSVETKTSQSRHSITSAQRSTRHGPPTQDGPVHYIMNRTRSRKQASFRSDNILAQGDHESITHHQPESVSHGARSQFKRRRSNAASSGSQCTWLVLWGIGIASLFICSKAQIHWNNLSTIGIIGTDSVHYKIMTRPSHQYLVIKLMPNVSLIDNCTKSELGEYEKLLNSVLEPINQALTLMTKNVKPLQSIGSSRRQRRFAGVVLAGAALGVATAAQITAGIALHQSNLNAQAIQSLRASLEQSNKAIEEIREATQETVIAVQGVQDYVNNELVPAMQHMSCELVGQKLGLKLLRYYTELLSIFGPSLRDPISAEISIQALSYALGGEIHKILEKLGYSGNDMIAILESRGIKTKITHVDLPGKLIILSISYPTLSEVKGVIIHRLEAVSYNIGSQEWYTTVPRYVATNGYLISNFDESSCVFVSESAICSQNSLYPMSPLLQQCIRGDTSSCARTLVSGTMGNKFILSKGNIVANCASILCKCYSTSTIINQSPDKLLTFIASDTCPLVEIDGVTIQVGGRQYPDMVYESKVALGPAISLERLDVGTNLGNALKKLDDAKVLIESSNQILETVRRSSFNFGSLLSVPILICIPLALVLLMYCCKRRYQQTLKQNTKIDPTFKPDLTGTSKSYVRSL
nr:fusion protein [Morbillivirus canis]WPS68853.1 fusion protein [Morbillivirus canis]WPS68861.1 fusion protein [Morbillivirus canis]WPS68868.1 fusion protein [Morbillivirus canis]